tara:strand:- start:193 stop:3939 length:3747 start_codon:yes stop_codon:yes gene_type:complete
MINRRIFGADIPVMVKKKLEARQKLAEGAKNPNDPINSDYKDSRMKGGPTNDGRYAYNELIENNFNMEADLSSRTPFARMWTAVSLCDSSQKPTEDQLRTANSIQRKEFLKWKPKILARKIYVVGTNNLSTLAKDTALNDMTSDSENFDSSTLVSVFPMEHSTADEITIKENGEEITKTVYDNNKFLKPQAGIISVSSETGGTLGAIKTTTIKFKVSNFNDFDNIYNRYFLRPGAQIFIDFGWDTLKYPLYDPNVFLDSNQIETELYGEKNSKDPSSKDGFITKNAGDVETLIGIVTGYESNINEDGSVECSLELTSKNSSLLGSAKNASDNSDRDSLRYQFQLDTLLLFESIYRLSANQDDIDDYTPNNNSSVETIDKFNKKVQKLAFDSFRAFNYVPSTTATLSGVAIIGTDISDSEKYISWGLIEDTLINKNFGHGNSAEEINTAKKENLQVALDSSAAFTTFTQAWINKQKSTQISPPKFIVPEFWDDSYSVNLNKSGLTEAGRTAEFSAEGKDFTELKKSFKEEFNEWLKESAPKVNEDYQFGFYRKSKPITDFDIEKRRVPIREIMIHSEVVLEAFTNSSNTTLKSVINDMLEKINEDSYGIWNWTLGSDGDDKRLSVIDTNFLDISSDTSQNKFNNIFQFNIMSKNSIVKNYNVSLSLPEGEIGSMYAIQALSGTNANIFPISKLVEQQSALQTIINKYGKNKDIGFRYLPDMAPYNAVKQSDSITNGVIYTDYYRDSAAVLKTKAGGGAYSSIVNIDNLDTAVESTTTTENDTSGNETEELKPMERIALNKQKYEKQGYITVNNSDEYWKLQTTGQFTIDAEEVNFFKPIPLPMTLSLTIYGISSLKPGDIFRVDYLPQVYIEKVYFQVIKVIHNVDSSGWYTELETQFRIRPDKYADDNILTVRSDKSSTSGKPISTKINEIDPNDTQDADKDATKPKINKQLLNDINQESLQERGMIIKKGSKSAINTVADTILFGDDVKATVEDLFPQGTDNSAYRGGSKYYGFACHIPSTANMTQHSYNMPTKGKLKNRGFWYSPTTKQNSIFKSDAPSDSYPNTYIPKGTDIKVIKNLEDLYGYMVDIQELDVTNLKHIKYACRCRFDGENPLLVVNPMYFYDWFGDYNYYLGYGASHFSKSGYGPQGVGDTDTKTQPHNWAVRGLYTTETWNATQGEPGILGTMVYFIVNGSSTKNLHWGVFPVAGGASQGADLRTLDFDTNYNFTEDSRKSRDAGVSGYSPQI